MRPTFLGFETARRGISVSQKALDITGNNLTNVNTPGYTRQRVDMSSIAPNTARNRLAAQRADMTGQGVGINGVSQTRDAFLDKRFRDEYGDFGYYDQYSAILSDIESALDEVNTDTGLKNAIAQMVKSLNDFAGNADSETHANIVATNMRNMTQVLHSFNTKLTNAAEQHKYDLGLSVESYNTTLQKIANLNKTIKEDVSSIGRPINEYYGSNELLDQRNLLLDELAQYGDMEVEQRSDGTIKVKVNGHVAVDDQWVDAIRYTKNNDGTVALNWQSSGERVDMTTGALKASVEMLNGRGPGAQSASEGLEKGFLYYKDKIDAFAQTLVSVFNKIVPELDAAGEPKKDAMGNPIYKTFFGAQEKELGPDGLPVDGKYVTNSNGRVTAENIAISDELAKDSNYLIYKKGERKSEFPLKMVNALTKDKITFSGRGGVFTGTFEDFVNNYVGEYGADLAFNTDRLAATSAIADDLLNRRDQVSGVSRDEEGTNMMMFQKSFEAAARLMTTLDEALDVLINRTGMVGR